MEELTEIMNRDYRTTKSVSMRSYATESSENCDKCQNERQTKHFAKSHHSVVKRSKYSLLRFVFGGIPGIAQHFK